MHAMTDNAYYITLIRVNSNRDVTALPSLKESRPEIPKGKKRGKRLHRLQRSSRSNDDIP